MLIRACVVARRPMLLLPILLHSLICLLHVTAAVRFESIDNGMVNCRLMFYRAALALRDLDAVSIWSCSQAVRLIQTHTLSGPHTELLIAGCYGKRGLADLSASHHYTLLLVAANANRETVCVVCRAWCQFLDNHIISTVIVNTKSTRHFAEWTKVVRIMNLVQGHADG